MKTFGQNFTLPLYPSGRIPNHKDVGEQEIQEFDEERQILIIRKVQIPDITVFLPAKPNATGEAVIICPGGGYEFLSYEWEGIDIARYWSSRGVAAIVLKYRVPTSKSQLIPHLSPLLDAQRAMRLVRHHALEWNIDPTRIGIMGFSAGGHLAATLSNHCDTGDPGSKDPIERISSRPAYCMLVYPVISFAATFSHEKSRISMLGTDPDNELVARYSNEQQVSKKHPPTFLIHAADDDKVPCENSTVYFASLRDHNIPAEMHLYPKGGHGFSLAIQDKHLNTWIDRCSDWANQLNS